ncbi:caveolae-associated protein 2b [Chanos chanos]|uniref:Caveolae-associated protein 2b n=1 Tax=Chanos chanos TaxID=29144 RepID=A0A6J2W3M1_CHACN|nr:caveolae-associated protein 2-like [Chanos chanos]
MMGEDAVQAEKSSVISTHESQELVVPSPSPTQSSPSHSLSGVGMAGVAADSGGAAGPGATGTLPREGVSPTGQVNAITVLTLLDKLVNMLDTVQENQHKMEQRQLEMEGAVRGIQNDMTKLSKSHTSTSNTVSKLLEKSRKVSVHMKEVKDKMDKQATQVKKLEANHAHLLKRNNFKVLIFQEENEIPATVFVKEPVPFPREGEEENVEVDPNRSQEEGLQTINLSSDEELGPEEEEEDEAISALELAGERVERSRAERIKRSSLKKVDSLKKAFSRQNIEKKMNKISTKIVSPEKREKIKKSLTPNHPKDPSAKKSSFKVSPLTFNIKKVRDGEVEAEAEAEADVEASAKSEGSPTAVASIELAPISSPDEDLPFTEVHSHLAPGQEEAKAAVEAMEKEEVPSASTSTAEPDLSISEGVSEEYALSATLPQDTSNLEVSHNGLQIEEDEEEEGEKEKEKEESPIEEAAASVAVEQTS